jgi:heptosyltransferase I
MVYPIYTLQTPQRKPNFVQSILIIRYGAIGDLLMTSPLLRSLRKTWPQAHIVYLCERSLQIVVEALEGMDEVISIDKRTDFQPAGLLALRKRLHDYQFDLTINLQPVFKTRLLAWVSGAKKVLTFKRDPRFGPKRAARRSAAENFVATLTPVGIHAATDGLHLSYRVSACAQAQAILLLAQLQLAQQRFLMVIPGASAANRCWPVQHLREVLLLLRQQLMHLDILILGGGADRTLIQALDAPGTVDAGIRVLIDGANLQVSAALMQRSAAVICMDSGPMHIAAAVGAPLVAIFGPTSAVRTGPAPPPPHSTTPAPIALTVQSGLTCHPCDARSCKRGDQACITGQHPQHIVQAVVTQTKTHVCLEQPDTATQI